MPGSAVSKRGRGEERELCGCCGELRGRSQGAWPGMPRRTASSVAAGLAAAGLPVRDQQAGPDRLGGQDAEEVEVGGLFILEKAHLVPGPARRAEYLITG